MKHIFSILLLLSLFSSSVAQSYTPVIINGEVFFKTQLETEEGVIFAEITVANFEQIDGQFYNRAFFKRGLDADMLVGYLREVPEEGRIYYRPQQDPQDILVYDISLEIGDEIELPARWCDGRSGDVAEVIAVREQEGRRELTFNRTVGEELICDTLRFLEGVGPSASLIFPHFAEAILANGVAMSVCHASHANDVFYPSNGSEDFCGLAITSTVEASATSPLILYPNPVQDELFIRNLPSDLDLIVYSSDGRRLFTGPAQATINGSDWPTGLLYLSFFRDGSLWRTERILKW